MSQRAATQGPQGFPEPVHKMVFLQALMSQGYMKEEECKKLFSSICNVRDASELPQALASINAELDFAHFKVKTVKSPVDQLKYVGFVNTQADAASKAGTRYSIGQRDFFKQAIEAISTSGNFCNDNPGAPCSGEITLLNLDAFASGATQAATQAATQGADGASQAVGAGKKLSMTEKKQALVELVSDGWLAWAPGKRDYYCLGARTFLELGNMLLGLDLPEETREAWQSML